MNENKNQNLASAEEFASVEETAVVDTVEVDTADNEPLDKNVRLMSPARMVARRFFRSKLSVAGLVMLVALFMFCWLGPVVYTRWGETEQDKSGKVEYREQAVTQIVNGEEVTFYQVVETGKELNALAKPSKDHILGTDTDGRDVFTRLMYGGRISLAVSFIAVFAITLFGIILGGVSGYFGGVVDNIIMRVCDILMCLPGFPILLIIGTLLDSMGVPSQFRIYYLMAYLTLFSWPGTARLVRGQILSLREQEYMVAAEAMGYSTGRKIFKHLVPNVMPQLIVSMSLSLGSMILYEATLSYLGLGVQLPYAAWGTMINVISQNPTYISAYPLIWVPAGICIVIAVLGFNFVGDGLRDALDPKARR